MYKFDFDETLPCQPLELFERTMRNFDEYEKFAPNVTRVQELFRERREDGIEKIILQIFARGILPAPALKFFNMNEISWKEFFTVDSRNLIVDWKVETPVFTEYVDCCGTSFCKPVDGGCKVLITGAMTIGAPPVKGVPAPAVQAAVGVLEPFIGKMITMNLKKYFKSMRECIEKEKAGRK